jgi:hypothetical protein
MEWITRLRHHVRAATSALPLESAAIGAAVVALWWLVAASGSDTAGRFLFAAVLATPVLFASTLLRRARGRARMAWSGLAIAGLVGAAAISFTGSTVDEAFAWRVGLALLASVMLPFVAVAVAAPPTERLLRFADFVRRFSEETTSSVLIGGLAIGAAAVLIGSIQTLFHVRLERFGADVAALIAGLTALAYLHRLLTDGGTGRVPDLWRRLIARVAAPFLVAMLALLAIYELWVVVRGELPANLISPLIIAAGAIGFASTLVIESLVAVREERLLSPANPHPWTAAASVRISRAFTAVLLALLPLAAWSLWVRLDQHGLTPIRAGRLYALAALGLLGVWGTLRWVRRRRPLGWEVPAVTAAVALLAAIGPLSVVSLSIRSQSARIDDALTRAGIARQVHTAPPADPIELDGAAFDDLADRIGELVEIGGLDALDDLLGGDLAPCRYRWSGSQCLNHLGVVAANRPVPSEGTGTFLASQTGPVVAGFRVVDASLDSRTDVDGLGLLAIDLVGDELVLSRDGRRWAGTRLGPLDTWGGEGGRVGDVPPLVDEKGCVVAHAIARSAHLTHGAGGTQLTRLDLLLLVPLAPRCP